MAWLNLLLSHHIAFLASLLALSRYRTTGLRREQSKQVSGVPRSRLIFVPHPPVPCSFPDRTNQHGGDVFFHREQVGWLCSVSTALLIMAGSKKYKRMSSRRVGLISFFPSSSSLPLLSQELQTPRSYLAILPPEELSCLTLL
ncbi:hypothetical protein F5Y16DRAFT_166168 [Xylariaceae sp. FL0255]|nr:hypothetical protein F5Y16DRAFT_166168 [Xylariaceae sp. FL0255]